jgi:hypothetical protein
MEAFKSSLVFSREDRLKPSQLGRGVDASLFEPDLRELWAFADSMPKLGEEVKVQQGHQFLPAESLKARGLLCSTKKPGWAPVAFWASDEYAVWELPIAGYLNFGPKTFRARGGGAKPGVSQVVINYAGPVQAWRFRPVVDTEGIAASSRFLTFRPAASAKHSLVTLWAVLLSPMANAYAYSWSSKRQTLKKEWLSFPLPDLTIAQQNEIETAADAYLKLAAKTREFMVMTPDETAVLQALLALDAAVLRLYDLPPHLERELLAIFDGVDRPGVGCTFRGYPPGWSSRPASPSINLPDDDRPIWERIASLAAILPEEAIAGLPNDGASELDHYLYGTPKRTS